MRLTASRDMTGPRPTPATTVCGGHLGHVQQRGGVPEGGRALRQLGRNPCAAKPVIVVEIERRPGRLQ